jgi:uncharacterized protein HemX
MNNAHRLLRRFLMLAAISLLFSGCGNAGTDDQKATVAQQEQEIIAKLQKRLDAEAEASRANALQSAVNQAAIYQCSGPLRSLPIWDNVELQVGQEAIKKSGLAPDWQTWAFLGMLYIAAAGAAGVAVGAIVGVGVGVVRKMRLLYALKQLRRLEGEVEAAREKLYERMRQVEETDRRLAQVQEEIQVLEQRMRNLPSEIEREKEKMRAEYQQTNENNAN